MAVDGRLTAEELSERIGRAYAARTLGDLDALATDLPPLQPPAPATARPGPADLPPGQRPPGPRQAAARAALVRTIVWQAFAVWGLRPDDDHDRRDRCRP